MKRYTSPAKSSTSNRRGFPALKKADKDGAIVLRVFEIQGDTAESRVRFLGQDRKFRAVNLLEEAGPIHERDVLRVEPYETGTVKLPIPEPTKGTN